MEGSGGYGCISFLRRYVNKFAGPDGGDGGNGGHVEFKATKEMDLNHLPPLLKAPLPWIECKSPVSETKNQLGEVVGDLSEKGSMFVGVRGGAGDKGNKFFATATEQVPKI